MTTHYLIKKPTVDELFFYKKCLSEQSWRRNYSSVEDKSPSADYLQQFALTEYHGVTRYLVANRSKPIGFFHIETKLISSRCTLAGGIDPEELGKGYGLAVAVIALDYLFSKSAYHKICCKVLDRNNVSKKMLLGLGFSLEGIAKEHEYDNGSNEYIDVNFLSLLRSNYPNSLVKKLLNKITYEKA
jgi:RimJ/RimL family protein N-acetyltransferase